MPKAIPISAEQLNAIIDHVKTDPVAAANINSLLADLLPDSWGAAGSIRNLGYILRGLDPSETEVYNKVCSGIAKETARIIDEQIKAGNPRFAGLDGASFEARSLDYPIIGSVAHDATTITTDDGQVMVIDWHHTLNTENPMVYPSLDDWKKEENGVTAESFIEEYGQNTPATARKFQGQLDSINDAIQELNANIN